MSEALENTVQEKIAVIYDAGATQRIVILDSEDDSQKVFAVVLPYSDEDYLEFRKNFAKNLNELLAKEDISFNEAKIKQAIIMNSEIADTLIETLENYPDLPTDWKETMSSEDKLEIFHKAHNFIINEDSKKLSFGDIIVPTACFFNGKIAQQTHKLRRKTIDDSSKYVLIQSKQQKVTPIQGRLEKKNKVEIVVQDSEKAALYDEMCIEVTGFLNDNIPIRVKTLVIDYIFLSSIDGKK